MTKFLLLICILFVGIFNTLSVQALGETSFTDVTPTDDYYSSVIELQKSGILSDNGDHLFRPHDLMARDFFVSLAVGIGCYECETPSMADIIKYQSPPFIDLKKMNRYYYCIAYAKEYNIAQGYILNTSGTALCENNTSYTSSPFCAENTISRIEAAAILLRRAHLWDDTLNAGGFERNITINDVTSYWYGYAKKGIEIGILEKNADGTIGQDTKITRGEFAIMAAKILKYTQCAVKNSNTVETAIITKNAQGITSNTNRFPEGSKDFLVPVTSGTGSWNYRWKLTNVETQSTETGNESTYPIEKISCGQWFVELETLDAITNNVVTRSTETIVIECKKTTTSALSVSISANPLVTFLEQIVQFSSQVNGGIGGIQYVWDFGDGTTSNEKNPNHAYTNSGVYTVILTVTDSVGNAAQSSLVVRVTGDKDTDKDGLKDSVPPTSSEKADQCPYVYAKTPTGCPDLETYTWPAWGTKDPSTTFFENTCLQKQQVQNGIMIGMANCTQCPCNTSIVISSALRTCDIVFPTILSPLHDAIYARGNFFLIQK